MDFIWEQMNKPAELDFSEFRHDMGSVRQRLYHISSHEKCSAVLGLVGEDEPALVFVNSRDSAYELVKRLETNGKKVVQLSRDSGRKSVLEIVGKVKTGDIQFIVAQDGAGFGLYNSGIRRVINYDLPENGSSYISRYLSAALSGADVLLDSFACERYVFNLESIEKYIGMKSKSVLWTVLYLQKIKALA